MSRRYSTYHPAATVTDDQLLAMLYGPDRARHEHPPVPGCVAVCCRPGGRIDGEAALWLVLWPILASEAAVIVAGLVLVLVMAWRAVA